jgi:subtilisin family serine protease
MAFLVVAGLCGSVSAEGAHPRAQPHARHLPRHAPGEVIVRFRAWTSATDRLRVRSAADARLEGTVGITRIQTLALPSGTDLEHAIEELERSPAVIYAEPNLLYQAATVPDDPDFPRLWSLNNSGAPVHGVPGTADADIDAPQAWEIATGSASVKVGIADTGVRYDNRDLRDNVWTHPSTGERGPDFITEDGDPLDENGHGTHVAGIVGARGGNGVGGVGVNWRTSLVPMRVLDAEGAGEADDIAEAFRWAGSAGVKVVNASFGGGGFSQTISDAIASAPNTLFVASAGNAIRDVDTQSNGAYPCNLAHPNVICVAATNQRDELAWYSNHGPVSVDLAAPGTEVLSTYPEQRVAFDDDFESSLEENWITEDPTRWGRSHRAARSGSWSMSDSPGGAYPANHEVEAELREPLDLRGEPCSLELFVDIDTGRNPDRVMVDYFTGSGGGSSVWSRTGAPVPLRENVRVPLEHTNVSGYRLRVYFRGDWRLVRPSEGVEIDDLRVECLSGAAGPDGEQLLSGTSMAAPHVTGVAALLWAEHPDWTVAQVRERILGTVDRLEALAGKVATDGRLNAYAALSGRYTEPLPIGDRPRVETVAGSGRGFSGDGGLATDAQLDGAWDVAALPDGGYVIADIFNARIRKVSPSGQISTIAGTGIAGYSGDGGPATHAQLDRPQSVAADVRGAILIADSGNDRVRRVDPDGTISTVPGGASLEEPRSVSAIPGGGFYVIANFGTLYRVSPDGALKQLPVLDTLNQVSATADGGALVTESDHAAWRLDSAGHATQVVGAESWRFGLDGEPANHWDPWRPSDVAELPDGGFVLADRHRITRVDSAGLRRRVAGVDYPGFRGDGGRADTALFNDPLGLSVASDGTLLVADSLNNRIRRIAPFTSAARPALDSGPERGTAPEHGGRTESREPNAQPDRKKRIRPWPRIALRFARVGTAIRVMSLWVGRPKGTTVSVRCRGRGCPTAPPRAVATRRVPVRWLAGALLQRGSRVDIAVRHPRLIGRWLRLRVGPRRVSRVERCLRPGRASPIRCTGR